MRPIAPPRSAGPANAPTRPDIRVLFNAGSGKRRGARAAAELRAILDLHPGRFDLRVVGQGARIEEEARRAIGDGFATVVAAGGDGTICAVASALAGTGTRMGVLSFGTFNYFSRSIGLPESLEDSVRVLVEGTPTPVDVGDVNGRLFLNNASIGAYASILERREDIYRRWGRGRLVAFWSVLVTLASLRGPMSLTLTVNGASRRLRTPLAFVAKNPYQLEQFDLEGAEAARSGKLALYLAPESSRFELITSAARLLFRKLRSDVHFELVSAEEIRIETRRPDRLVARDGERERMRSPFVFKVRPGALNVIVPAASA